VADAKQDTASLAVWDVPMPVVAGERFSIKVGVKSASGRSLAGQCVVACNAAGTVVASGVLGNEPWACTEGLNWAALELPAPGQPQVTEYAARFGAAATWFSVAAAAKPEHTLNVQVTERDTKAALEGVEIRLGPFHARTDKAGRAELRVCKGDYQLQLWRTAHIASPEPVHIDGDVKIALTMIHVPEEHPDARWVR
jgi:hypothetical protein